MIIAAFAGTGKTYFCEHVPQAIDFVCMPWKYTNFYEVAAFLEEGEQIKANDELELRFGWIEEYYKAIVDTVTKYPDQIVVIPTISAVLTKLEEEQIPYTLVMPHRELKEEYRQRYIARGNTEDFLDIFVGDWDCWMEELRMHNANKIIELGSGEYLTDKVKVNKMNPDVNSYIINKKSYVCMSSKNKVDREGKVNIHMKTRF